MADIPFDSVCTGIADCIQLVNYDIKEMTDSQQNRAESVSIARSRSSSSSDIYSSYSSATRHKSSFLRSLFGRSSGGSRTWSRHRHQLQQQDSTSTSNAMMMMIDEEKNPANISAEDAAEQRRLQADEINRQIRLAMQYAKQLANNLTKVEDLHAKYKLHLKMALSMESVKEFYLSPAPVTAAALAKSSAALHGNNKSSIKDFIENINRLETELESYMGSFLLTVDNIQGFARICQGDVFAITIKYGDTQKFKTKISVLKDNQQKCDNKQTIFKARLRDVLAIKAYECKGLCNKQLLGHKLCETRDFFTARSQLMTISLNQTGSIKLNLIITWNPLHYSPYLPTQLSHDY